jgi:hypothetical protein
MITGVGINAQISVGSFSGGEEGAHRTTEFRGHGCTGYRDRYGLERLPASDELLGVMTLP